MKNNQAPGYTGSQDMAAIQNYIKAQHYIKGFTASVLVGSNPNIGQIQLGGQARFMLGIVILSNVVADPPVDTVSLAINNEQIITDANVGLFDPRTNGNSRREYFPLPRPLSGADSVELDYTVNTVVGKDVYIAFYLSNFAPTLKDLQQ